MIQFPDIGMVEQLKKEFKTGAIVELEYMNDPYSKLKIGDTGVVRSVSDEGDIIVELKNGEKITVTYGIDRCRVIE